MKKWNKEFIYILVFLVFSFSVFAIDINILDIGFIPFGSATGGGFTNRGASNEITVVPFKPSGMEVTINLPGFYLENSVYENKVWHKIVYNGQSFQGDAGSPNVPFTRSMFACPKGSDFKITVTDVQYEKYENVNLEPAQPYFLETEKPEHYKFSINEKIYNTNAFYPEAWAGANLAGIYHGTQLGEALVYPFRYNPVTNILYAAYSITFTVEFLSLDDPGNLDYQNGISKPLPEALRHMIINYEFAGNVSHRSGSGLMDAPQETGAVDYLILSDSKFMASTSSLHDLVKYHEQAGRNVSLVNVSAIGTTSDAIKAYIQDLYDSHNPVELEHVLIVADETVVPVREKAYKSSDADIWYAWLDGDDFIADVGLGRLPARNETELAVMVNKTLDYHRNTFGGQWRNRSLLIAHQQDYPGKYTKCNQMIFDMTYDISAPVMDRMFPGAPDQTWTNDDINNAINNGRGVVNYRGHGNRSAFTGWNGTYYTIDNVNQLINGKRTPVIFSIACETAEIQDSEECIGEAFLRHSKGGAVAFLGANAPSFTSVNDTFNRALYEGTWNKGVVYIGDLLNYANLEAQRIHGETMNQAIYLWLGDPALSIRDAGPKSNNINAVMTIINALLLD